MSDAKYNGNSAAIPYLFRDIPNMGPMYEFGLTKREYFAIHADGFNEDSDPKYVAQCLGWPVPDISPSDYEAWQAWWRKAEATWKVRNADALLAALEESKE